MVVERGGGDRTDLELAVGDDWGWGRNHFGVGGRDYSNEGLRSGWGGGSG